MELRLPKFLGKIGHLVLKNRTTFLGSFLQIENAMIFLKDQNGKMHKFPISEVEEAVFDTESAR